MSDNGFAETNDWLTWDRRGPSPSALNSLTWNPALFRLATLADIAAFEARIPGATPSFKVGDLVMPTTGKRWAGVVGPSPMLEVGTTVVRIGQSYLPQYEVRPATDTEVAAYHRQHCAGNAAASPISNATHAGRRVRYTGSFGPWSGVVVTESAAAKLHPDYKVVNTVVAINDTGMTAYAPAHLLALL